MAVVASSSNSVIILGVTHLLVDGQLKPLLKCSFCDSLSNIHIEVIEHHIRLTHPGKSYSVSDFYHKGARTASRYGPYFSKEELKLPWISCLFCGYKDKIEFDLSLHMLEKHKEKLLQIPISSQDRKQTKNMLDPCSRLFAKFEAAIEFRLDVAVEMAKKENRDLGVKHAIRQIQKRILKRRKKKEVSGVKGFD